MESLASYTTLKDGFKIVISKSDTELTIEAEDQATGNTFSAKFTDGTIKIMSLELFENMPELFEGLVMAFKGLSEDLSVRVYPNGKILLTQKLNIGKHEKVLKFPIPLKPVEMEPKDSLKGVMIKVLKEVEGLREEVKGLKSEVVKVNRENRQLQEKLTMDYYEIIYPTFDASDAFVKECEISNDRKTIAPINNQLTNLLRSDTILPREKNSKFRVKIDNRYPHNLVIGVAVKDVLKNNSLSSSGTYCLVFPNKIHVNGSSYQINKNNSFTSTTDKIVGVQYIPSRKEIRFDINGEHTSLTISDGQYQKLDVIPIIRVTGDDLKISFI